MANWVQNIGRSIGTRLLKLTGGVQFFPIGTNKVAYTRLSCPSDYRAALEACAPLAAILTLAADAFSNGTFEVLNRTTRNYTRGQYKEWDRLLNRPNPFQNRAQFLKQLYLYTKMNGYCYAIPVYPSGFKDRPSSVWLLPPWCIDVELKDKNKLPYSYKVGESVRKVFFSYNGVRTELKEEELILFTDSTPNIDENTWLPESCLLPLQGAISIFTNSEEAGNTLLKKRGPMGFISGDYKDVLGPINNPDDEEKLQNKLQKYGLSEDQWQYVVTTQSMKWVPIGVNIADLHLDENQLNAVKAMCFVLGYPFPLTPYSDQSTYNNVLQAGKDLYQNTIIPQAANIIEQYNEGLKTPDQNIEFVVSYEDVAALQQSQQEQGDGLRSNNQAWQILWNNGNCTRNEWREAIGMDTISDALFDKYKFQMTPEELGIVNQNIGNDNPAKAK